jgi:hypothetical protein
MQFCETRPKVDDITTLSSGETSAIRRYVVSVTSSALHFSYQSLQHFGISVKEALKV